MTATVTVRGARELRATMRRADVELTELRDVHAAVAGLVAGAARPAAPRDTGALASTVRGNRAQSRATVSAGFGRIPYAGPVHWGWPARNITAQPWIADTATRTEPTWVQLYRAGVARIVSRIRGV